MFFAFFGNFFTENLGKAERVRKCFLYVRTHNKISFRKNFLTCSSHVFIIALMLRLFCGKVRNGGKYAETFNRISAGFRYSASISAKKETNKCQQNTHSQLNEHTV